MKPVICDFETYYDTEYSLSRIPTEEYIRDERFKVHGAGIKIADGPSFWVTGRLLPAFFERANLHNHCIIGHNLNFDSGILAMKYGVYPKLNIDTLGMSRALVGPHSTRHGLKYISKLLCNMDKLDGLVHTRGVRDLSAQDEARLADYCIAAPREVDGELFAGDTELTYAIFKKMIPHFPRNELPVLNWVTEAFTKPQVYLDGELLGNYLEHVLKLKEDALREAGLEDRDVLMSNPKFAEALEQFGVIPPTKVNAKGKVAFAFAKTDEGLKELLEHPDVRVQAIVAARLAVKTTIEETRTARFMGASTRGAFPMPYNYSGANVTHRFSGTDKYNVANLSRQKYDEHGPVPNTGMLRKSIYADEGQEIGVADLSQIEARMTLWLGMQISGESAGNAEYDSLEVMRNNGDLYSWFGTRIYGYEINKKSHPTERQVAKSAVLGLGFGMGPTRFLEYCKQSNIPMDEMFAKNVVDLYRGTYVGVRKFWGQCTKAINMLLDGNYGVMLPLDGNSVVETALDPLFNQPAIKLPGGLYIKYPDLQKDVEGQITYQQGPMRSRLFGGKVCENIVQAVAAQFMREQLKEIHPLYPVFMSTYDELACVIPEGEGDAWLKTITPIMTRSPIYMPGLPVGIEASTAIRYGDCK